MSLSSISNFKNSVIIDIDNYTNEHLNDPIFIKYLISFSEKGGASGFLSKDLDNLKILKESTCLPIFAEIQENFDYILLPKTYNNFKNIVESNRDFIIIEICDFDGNRNLEKLINEIRNNFKGQLIGKVSNKSQAIQGYRLGMDALLIEVFGDNIEEEIISNICFDINIPTIANLNSVNMEQSKKLTELGIHTFILGEDITNPNKIIKKLLV